MTLHVVRDSLKSLCCVVAKDTQVILCLEQEDKKTTGFDIFITDYFY